MSAIPRASEAAWGKYVITHVVGDLRMHWLVAATDRAEALVRFAEMLHDGTNEPMLRVVDQVDVAELYGIIDEEGKHG